MSTWEEYRPRWSKVKSALVVGAGSMVRNLPPPVGRVATKALFGGLRSSYWMPRNPLRAGCEDFAVVAAAYGHDYHAGEIYRGILRQLEHVGRGVLDVCYNGRKVGPRWAEYSASTKRMILDQLDRYGGLVLAVPHNAGSVLGAIGMAEFCDPLILARNRTGERHNNVSKELYDRMGVEVCMVRDFTPVHVGREVFRALASGRPVVATLDYVWRKPDAVSLPIFGQQVGFAPWAADFAVRRGVPLLPAYPVIIDGKIDLKLGEPLVGDTLLPLAQHFVSFLEENVLRDPYSWAFLFDKRWRSFIRQARQEIDRGVFEAVPSRSRAPEPAG